MVTTRGEKSKRTSRKRKNDKDSASSSTQASKKHKGKEKIECAVTLNEDITETDLMDDNIEPNTDIADDNIEANTELDNDKIEDTEDEYDEDGEEIDWEAVELPKFSEKPEYNDVEITMDSPITRKKSFVELAYQRALRDWIHNSHVLCLIAHYKLRNRWCSNPEIYSIFKSIIPDEILQSDTISGVKELLLWWKEYFTLTGPGLQARSYNYFNYVKDVKSVQRLIERNKSNEEGDCIENFEVFLDLLSLKAGTRDTSAQLFVAALRSCGYEARLLCSLQPVSYKSPTSTKESDSLLLQEEEAPTAVQFEFRRNLRAPVDINVQLKDSKAKPPIVWAEVFLEDRWVCVDPIRGLIDQPLRMEPAQLDRTNRLSLVLAFEPVNRKGRGNITDVTRRYTSYYEKAIKERERPLTKRETAAGVKLWSESCLAILTRSNVMKDRDIEEKQGLDQRRFHEVMPKAIGKFHNHSMYALERHLKKFEILYPKEPVLGVIRGEKVYPRECVKTLCTADTFRKAGREIKRGEQPLKMVKAIAVTIEKKREKERAKQEGNEMTVPCYGEWQTQLYVPPPIVNGKIVKNSYGNIDLFKPTMLPKGAAHIPIKGISKMANKLGIDYADAVVDFEFVKMRAVPVINGIVVAEESRYVLLEAWDEQERGEAIKAIEKQEKDTLLRWRKLIKTLLIKARVDRDYGKEKKDDVWASYGNNEGGGGFLPEE
ncbi:hypothetical protein MFLAVUS_009298 [Mucor flavus]|uniref:Uncharacterized protein n=1 Tax=Mucor flavus TaxID=439312 RepID=A0ABP9Z9L1_9FUNG